MHFEDGVALRRAGDRPASELGAADAQVVRFGALNLFFGGVQAVLRARRRADGAGDPRRGGVAVSA